MFIAEISMSLKFEVVDFEYFQCTEVESTECFEAEK